MSIFLRLEKGLRNLCEVRLDFCFLIFAKIRGMKRLWKSPKNMASGDKIIADVLGQFKNDEKPKAPPEAGLW